MPQSQRGVRIAEGLRRSAAERKCPECSRHGALVDASDQNRYGSVCRWAPRLCSWPGAFVSRR